MTCAWIAYLYQRLCLQFRIDKEKDGKIIFYVFDKLSISRSNNETPDLCILITNLKVPSLKTYVFEKSTFD